MWDSAVKDKDMEDQRRALIGKGFAYLAMRSLDKEQKMADEYLKMCEESMNKRLIGGYYHLQGRIELERKAYARAVEYFNKALNLLSANSSSHFVITESLALAYYRIGYLEQARREYDKIDTFYNGRITYGDIYAKSFYMLGKIYEQQSDTAKTIDHYEKFLSLWKDADPGIAEVDDARERLAGLR